MYRSLIVCNSRYPEDPALRELHGPKTDGQLLKDALTDHRTGMFGENDAQVLEDRDSLEVTRAIDDFFSDAEPDDTLLFYYSGHGRSRYQQLFLCARNTVVAKLHSTAVSESTLNGIISNSRAQVKIIILDCCYSGLFKGSDLIEGLSGTGRYVIAASSATDPAVDGGVHGMSSPFTRLLTIALLSGAIDRDGDGNIDLDDIFTYLTSVQFEGPRPHRKFDGSGAIPIARRPGKVSIEQSTHHTTPSAMPTFSDNRSDDSTLPEGNLPYLETLASGALFSPERVAEFRGRLRDDIASSMPGQLTATEFLQRAGLLRHGALTYAGVLLFGDNPTTVLPTAMVQCVRFYGTQKTDRLESVDFQDTIPEVIVAARDFVANLARIGEAPTTEGAYAETVYKFPMIAVREIIANAVVHRNYQDHESCVQIQVFTDRIEVVSPGAWGGTPPTEAGTQERLGQLERQSQRRNFRLARTLTWSKLVEGVGAGIPRAIADCTAVGAEEPIVRLSNRTVTVTIFPGRHGGEVSATDTTAADSTSSANRPAIWGNVPQRNKNFTGRENVLAELRERLEDGATVLMPHALQGLGGVGKTQLAIEYAHRYANNYDTVWWIPADQPGIIRSTIAGLAPRLGLTGLAPGRTEDAVAAVLDALRRGESARRWLLVFDNADQPELVREFMPSGPGHIIVTSRNRRWQSLTDSVEVDVFTRAESQQFLFRRVPGITEQDSDRLAEALGDLPLGLEQAASLIAEAGMTVDVYLELLEAQASNVLSETLPSSDYPLPVAAAWNLSVNRLREQTPQAMELLQRCAFFGPDPISLELLERGRYVLGPPLRETLGDPIIMGRAIRALGRYALARIDNYERTLQVHRIIQRLIRDDIAADDRFKMEHDVHLLMAAADPGDPDAIDNWPRYESLLAHVGPSGLLRCQAEEVRRLAQNIVRYLYITGNYSAALSLAEEARVRWTADSGENDLHVLIISRLVAQILRGLARYDESYEITNSTMEGMSAVLGDDHEETLILMSGRCIDFMARGQFKASLDLATEMLARYKTIFGIEHPRTFDAMNSLAENLELNGDYSAAREQYEEVCELERNFYGREDHPAILFTLNALARSLREQGQYSKALGIGEDAYRGYQDLIQEKVLTEGHPWVLQHIADLAVTQRTVSAFAKGLELAHIAHDRYQRAFGSRHPGTLVAAANLGKAQLASGDILRADETLAETLQRYRFVLGDDHPYTQCCAIDLATVKRRMGDSESARRLLMEASNTLNSRVGPEHPYSLACSAELATTMVELGQVSHAVELEVEVLSKFKEVLGANHPDTLACASNLAIDLKTLGQLQRADNLISDVLTRFQHALGTDHSNFKATQEGQRLDLSISLTAMF